MAISCVPSSLVAAATAAGFEQVAVSDVEARAVELYLLRSIAALTSQTPAQLAESAKCFQCMGQKEFLSIRNYLLCQIVNK